MKFVLACYGVRGDVEPSVVVGRELMRRGHDVCIAIPPNLVAFAESAGLTSVAYGLDSRAISEVQRDYWTCVFRCICQFWCCSDAHAAVVCAA